MAESRLAAFDARFGTPPLSGHSAGWGGDDLRIMHHRHAPTSGDLALPGIAGHHEVCVLRSTGGRLSRKADGLWKDRRAAAGLVGITPAGRAETWAWNDPVEVLHLGVGVNLLAELANELELAPAPPEVLDRFLVRDAFIERVGAVLFDELCRGDRARPVDRLTRDALGRSLALHLIRTHSAAGQGTDAALPKAGGLPPFQLARALDFLEANLAREFGLAELAAAVGLTPWHFSRQFAAETGLSPHRYAARRRMEEAARLLAGTDIPIAAVAMRVGYSSQGHFTTAFGRHMRVTPGQYRSMARPRSGPS